MLITASRLAKTMEIPDLFLVEERIKTFKKWPFNSKDQCNIQNMAEAGFYSVATCEDDADAAKCFLCGKELDGWEPSDDPWSEHKSHAAQCAFVQIGKKENDLLLSEMLSIAEQYMINWASKVIPEAFHQQINDRAKVLKRRIVY